MHVLRSFKQSNQLREFLTVDAQKRWRTTINTLPTYKMKKDVEKSRASLNNGFVIFFFSFFFFWLSSVENHIYIYTFPFFDDLKTCLTVGGKTLILNCWELKFKFVVKFENLKNGKHVVSKK